MNYWITSQWPREVAEANTAREWAVWLPDDGRQEAGRELQAGDLVLIYESKTGRRRTERQSDGSMRRVPRQEGQQGIIGIIRLTGPLSERSQARRHQYDDGSEIRWGYQAQGSPYNLNGYVHRFQVNPILGYRRGHNFRGFGHLHSGLKRLTAAQFQALEAAFAAQGRRATP